MHLRVFSINIVSAILEYIYMYIHGWQFPSDIIFF